MFFLIINTQRIKCSLGYIALTICIALLPTLSLAEESRTGGRTSSNESSQVEVKKKRSTSKDQQVLAERIFAPRTVVAMEGEEPTAYEQNLLDRLVQERRAGNREAAAQLQAELDALKGIVSSPLAVRDVDSEGIVDQSPLSDKLDFDWNDGDILITDLSYGEVKPSITSTSDGDLYVAVERLDDSRIAVYKSTDNGQSWSWFTSWPDSGEDSHNPSITYIENSSEQWVCVVYERVETDGTRTVRFFRMDADKASYDFVSVQSGIAMASAGDHIYPRITSDNIEFATAPYLYLTYALYGIDYYPVYFTKSTDLGLTWTTPANVTGGAENSSSPTQPDIAYGDSGLFITFKKLGWTASSDTMDQDASVEESQSDDAQMSYDTSDEGLFSAASVSGDSVLQEEPSVKRHRFVEVNLGNLGTKQAPTQRVKLNLFEDTSFMANFVRSETNVMGSYAWVGELEGVPLSQAVLSVTNGVLSGSISMPGASYQISPSSDAVYLVEETDHSVYPPELPPIEVPSVLLDTEADVSGDDPCTEIKVLVAYTPEARAADGGTANIESRIALAVTETNQSYINSNITQRLVLAGTLETTSGDAANDFSTDLYALQDTSDGIFDNVDTERESLYADVVSLIIENSASCGLGFVNSTAAWAFSVAHRTCATGYYSFGHELGHNMGARHDWYVTDILNSNYSYNKGFVNVTDAWRTIMAYNNLCDAYSSINCTRLQYWSNPSVSYGGDAMGVSSAGPTNCVSGSFTPNPSSCAADNHMVLNSTCSTVANFRQDPVTGSWDNQIFVTKSSNWGGDWDSPTQLTTGTNDKYHPRVAVSHNEDSIVIAFTYDFGTDTDIAYISSVDNGSTWDGLGLLPWTLDDEEGVDLAVSNDQGSFHAVYWHDYDIMYTTAAVATPTSWSDPATVVNEMNYASLTYVRPSVTVNPVLSQDKEAAVVWSDFRSGYGVYFDSPFSLTTGKFLPAVYLLLLLNK